MRSAERPTLTTEQEILVDEYTRVTAEQAYYQGRVVALGIQRAQIAAKLADDGLSYSQIADKLNLGENAKDGGKARAQQLVEKGRRDPAAEMATGHPSRSLL